MKSSAEYNRLEITGESEFDSNGEYVRSTLYISHDGGQDKEKVRTYEQIQELSTENISEIFSNYIDKYL